jgi:hypothetical protein
VACWAAVNKSHQLDNFNPLNDPYGHVAGDRVLLLFTTRICHLFYFSIANTAPLPGSTGLSNVRLWISPYLNKPRSER